MAISIESVKASAEPSSSIYAVTDTNGADGGFMALVDLMGVNGAPFYASPKKGMNRGKDGLFAADDVVILKVNSQWDERGGTNTDLVQAVIHALLSHPDGFKGEVVVADNGQAQYGAAGYGGSLEWERNNALERSQSLSDVVKSFNTRRVSTYLWDDITGNVVQEYADGDMEDGYIVSTRVTQNGVIVSYPKFTTSLAAMVSFRHGVYDPVKDDYQYDRLKVINMPVLKTHMIYGVTGAVKNYMGVPSDKLTASLRHRIHNTVGRGGMGTLMAQTRAPTLNIMDAIHVNAQPHEGPRTRYAAATEVDVVAASTDPVALDYWASKNILCTACDLSHGMEHESMNPDNVRRGDFGHWLRLSMDELNTAGYGFTCEEERLNVHVTRLNTAN